MRDGKGGDYFKANAIREKCTVGKSSGRAPLIYVDFVLVRRGRGDECFDDGRRIVFETAKKERGRRRRRTAKESVLFRRLVSPRAGKKAFHHFPLPLSSIHDSLRHDARRHRPRPRPLALLCASERACPHETVSARSLAERASSAREAGGGRRCPVRGGVAGRLVFQTRGMMTTMHRLLPTDGRTKGTDSATSVLLRPRPAPPALETCFDFPPSLGLLPKYALGISTSSSHSSVGVIVDDDVANRHSNSGLISQDDDDDDQVLGKWGQLRMSA